MTNSAHILLIGCGGHGRVVLDAALASGLSVSGIIDGNLQVGDRVFGVPVLGDDDVLDAQEFLGAQWLNGIGANPNLARRRSIYEKMMARFALVGVEHPSVVAGRLGSVGTGVQLMAGSVVQSGTSFGDNSVVNTGSRIDHDCQIGRHCFVAPGATLCGGVIVGDGVFIGAAAVVLPGINVGDCAIIAAGSTVTQNVSARAVMVGSPSRQTRWNDT